ncbi:acetolactate synthase [bacterium]|nr:acetolactate synthase [bacterium]
MSIGNDSTTKFQTLRGHNFPAIRQFTIFLENRVGQLLEVVKRFEGTGIRVCALSINDAAECAFVRFLVSDADRGREILERSGLSIIETDLVGVELPSGPQPLLRVCTALLQAELNIIQAYPLIVRPNGKPAVAIMVENIELAMETLREKGFTIISEGDLGDDPIREN